MARPSRRGCEFGGDATTIASGLDTSSTLNEAYHHDEADENERTWLMPPLMHVTSLTAAPDGQ